MEVETNLLIEEMSAEEIRRIINDLNDKNQMLETHLNLMKKGFQVMTKFKSFLNDICFKFKHLFSEDESRELYAFESQLSEIDHGHLSNNILINSSMAESLDGSLFKISAFEKRSKSVVNQTSDKSAIIPIHTCPQKNCSQVFRNKTQLKKHKNKCVKSLKTGESCDSLEVRQQSVDMRLKNKMNSSLKTYSKIDSSCQTPFSSISMSLATDSLETEYFVCLHSGCDYKCNSLMELMGHKLSSHSNTTSDGNNQEKPPKNEELFVSHSTDLSKYSFGEWIDDNSDSYFKCLESSCGALFPEGSDLLRHMEVHVSSDTDCTVFDEQQDDPFLITEHELDKDNEKIEGSDHMLAMDPFVEQQTYSDNHFPGIEDNLLSDPPLKCIEQLCEMTFEIIGDLMAHLKTAHNKRVKSCTFKGCTFLYENRTELWSHLNECHKGQELPFKCSHRSCNKAFLTNADLNRHITSFHAVDRYSNLSGIFQSDTLSNCQSVKRKKT